MAATVPWSWSARCHTNAITCSDHQGRKSLPLGILIVQEEPQKQLSGYTKKDHRQAGLNLAKLSSNKELDPLFSFATLPSREFFLEIHRKEEK